MYKSLIQIFPHKLSDLVLYESKRNERSDGWTYNPLVCAQERPFLNDNVVIVVQNKSQLFDDTGILI
jgi:hypothetical protein